MAAAYSSIESAPSLTSSKALSSAVVDNTILKKMQVEAMEAEHNADIATRAVEKATAALKKWNRAWLLRRLFQFERRRRERKVKTCWEQHQNLLEYSLLVKRMYSACLEEEERQ